MLYSKKIKSIVAREILDSRGNPTVEVTVTLKGGVHGRASVPSGASTGKHEALELRDGVKNRYGGKGVLKAVKNVNGPIHLLLKDLDVTRLQDLDKLMLKLDGTDNKSKLGANAILGVSLACARAGAKYFGLPLYEYLRKIYKIHYKDYKLPQPMMNILNGGAHAGWAMDIQEFMIIPKASSFSERVRYGAEIFHALGKVIKDKGVLPLVGDEGGYALRLKNNEEGFKLILAAIKNAKYKIGKDVTLGMDVASSGFYNEKAKTYRFNRKSIKAQQLIALYDKWIKKYYLESIEDGLAEDDWSNWQKMTTKLGDKVLLVGDDLFVTNIERLQKGIDMKVANAILIKLNQIGTMTETIKAIYLAKLNKYKVIISHRSGETTDTTIADLAVAVNADYIKTGSLSRSERIAKYNRLMEIESEL